MNCPKCGAPIQEGAKFCTECGTPIQQAAPSGQPVQQPVQAPVPQPAQPVRPPVPQQQQQPAQPTWQQPQGQYPQGQPYGRQNYQGAPQFYQQPIAQKKKSKAPVIILIVVLVIAIAAAGIFLLPQLLGLRKNTPPEKVPTPVSSSAPALGSSEKPAEPSPSPSEEPAAVNDPFPTQLKDVPADRQVYRLGGLSVAVPREYEIEAEYDDEITLLHPEYPDIISQVMLVCEGDLEPGNEMDGIDELKENIGNIIEETEIKGTGYTCHYLRGLIDAEALGITFTTHCYIFVKEGEVYAVAIMTDGKDERVENGMEIIAFDPKASVSQEGPGSDSGKPSPGAAYQAQGDPTLDDFKWAINLENQKPEEYASTYSEIAGTWKCCVYFDDIEAYELCIGTFSGDDDLIEFELRPYSFQYNGEAPILETDEDPLMLYGSFDDGDLFLEGVVQIGAAAIYNWNGKQYLSGRVTIDEDVYALWMVRP